MTLTSTCFDKLFSSYRVISARLDTRGAVDRELLPLLLIRAACSPQRPLPQTKSSCPPTSARQISQSPSPFSSCSSMAPPTHPVSDATITAHTKLRFDSTGDPYLPIRPVKNRPKSLYHLTPLYPADLPALVATLNHPAVWPNLCGSPFPYSMAHAEQWLTIQEERTSSILGDLGKGHK